MMVVGTLVPAALGIAANPPAVVAVMLLLSASATRKPATAFVAGWAAGLFLAGGFIIAASDVIATLDDPTALMLVLRLAIGAVLVALGVREFLSRGKAAKEPAWMQSLSRLSAGKAFGVAALFSGLNPKTLAFNAAGCLAIADAGLTVPAQIAALAAFVALSSVSVALPLLYAFVAPARAEIQLGAARDWLVRNSSVITAVVLVVLGVLLIAGALEKL